MLTQESRARLRALATDALRGGYDYEAHEEPYVNLAGCVCITPATMIALLTALDAADAVAKAAREILENEPSYAGGWLSDALDEYDAATTAKDADAR